MARVDLRHSPITGLPYELEDALDQAEEMMANMVSENAALQEHISDLTRQLNNAKRESRFFSEKSLVFEGKYVRARA